MWQGTTPVALKMLKRQDMSEEFLSEAAMLAKLSAHNIVRFFGTSMRETCLFCLALWYLCPSDLSAVSVCLPSLSVYRLCLLSVCLPSLSGSLRLFDWSTLLLWLLFFVSLFCSYEYYMWVCVYMCLYVRVEYVWCTGLHSDNSGYKYIVCEYMAKGSLLTVLQEEGQSLTTQDLISLYVSA